MDLRMQTRGDRDTVKNLQNSIQTILVRLHVMRQWRRGAERPVSPGPCPLAGLRETSPKGKILTIEAARP
jgi:hypothetical protein